uniref:Uncharacterized protein n=1 Tax=Anopheles farauti TaxID=69004 RepID=A0A182QSM6_9DIPT
MKVIIALVLFVACAAQVYSACIDTNTLYKNQHELGYGSPGKPNQLIHSTTMKSILAVVLFVACASQVYSACVKSYAREPAPIYSALPYDPVVEVAPFHNNYYNYPYALNYPYAFNYPYGFNYPYRHGGCGCGRCASCKDCIKQGPCVEQNAVPLYDTDGHYYPYELGSNCLVKYYHPTDLSNCRSKTCGCGTCSSCRQRAHYPHGLPCRGLLNRPYPYWF